MGSLTFLLSLLFFPQEADPFNLVEHLGDSDPAVRDAAQESLRKHRSHALEALRRAAQDSDGERVVRTEVMQDWASKVKVGQECDILVWQ